jgi:hypothetical protein
MSIIVSICLLAICATSFFVLAKPTAPAMQDHTMKIDLTGGAEVPGPGDKDGSGSVELTFNAAKNEVCYDFSVTGTQPVTGAHIHAGAAAASGAVKVPLKKGADGNWKGCVSVDKALLADIMKNPANYYVNVHTAEFKLRFEVSWDTNAT